jgi:hypothetical protein
MLDDGASTKKDHEVTYHRHSHTELKGHTDFGNNGVKGTHDMKRILF